MLICRTTSEKGWKPLSYTSPLDFERCGPFTFHGTHIDAFSLLKFWPIGSRSSGVGLILVCHGK